MSGTMKRGIAVRMLVGLAAGLVVAACRAAGATAIGAAPELPGQSVITMGYQPINDANPSQMLVARMVPSFGGYFVDADGRPAVFLTNSLEEPVAAIALRGFLASRGFEASDLRVLPARFRYAQLTEWYRLARPNAGTVAGVVSGVVDEQLNRLRFGVTSAAAGAELMGALTAADVPPTAVVIELVDGTSSVQ